MILRYKGCPDTPGSKHFHELPGMVVGHAYEVAEIFEVEGHVMAREPGAPLWPGPGDCGFGIHPDWFEPTDQPIPIISCGLSCMDDYFDRAFGVLVHDPVHVEKLRKLKEFEDAFPDQDGDVPAWLERIAAEFTPKVARAMYSFVELPIGCRLTICDDVYWSSDPKLKPSFAFVGSHSDMMGGMEVSRALVEYCVRAFLDAVGIDAPQAAVLSAEIWRGTSGCERLINAPPDGRLQYRRAQPTSRGPGEATSK